MKTNELKIGNFVYFLGNVHEIEGLSKRLRPDVGHFLLSNMEHAQKGFHLKPIPLTEEWLFKFGKIGWLSKDIDGFFVWFNGRKIYIKFVHSLQNMYFCIEQKELI